eukprot:3013298-Amphidinium_carterae.1
MLDVLMQVITQPKKLKRRCVSVALSYSELVTRTIHSRLPYPPGLFIPPALGQQYSKATTTRTLDGHGQIRPCMCNLCHSTTCLQ